MMTKMTDIEKKNWYKYKIPGGSNLHRVKINKISLSVANSKEHEMCKCSIAYDLMKNGEKVITEASELATSLQRDLVSLSTGEIYEIDSSESKRGRRHPKNINVYWYDLGRFRTREEVEVIT